MAREHMPIQIGLPSEPAWEMAEPEPIAYIAFIEGDELPDPGAAFIALGESFGVAPQDTEALPIDDERVAWAFACSIPGRAARVMIVCEHARADASPDGQAGAARWVIILESLLESAPESARAVDDAVALAASAARVGGARTRLLFDPGLGVTWARGEIDRLFLSKPRGALVDERTLYRVELVAKDRERGPFWISTVGLARLGKPELELLEIDHDSVRPALELIDAVAARFVGEQLPHAGVPFEAGPGFHLALVPAAEACEALAPDAPGGVRDRAAMPRHPRAAICAAGKRGAFRQVWVPPTTELSRLSRGELGVYLAPRVSLVRERIAQQAWDAVARAWRGRGGASAFLAKIARGDAVGERAHVWITVDRVDDAGGGGVLARADGTTEAIAFGVAQVGDWRILGLRPDLAEVGPESAALLD